MGFCNTSPKQRDLRQAEMKIGRVAARGAAGCRLPETAEKCEVFPVGIFSRGLSCFAVPQGCANQSGHEPLQRWVNPCGNDRNRIAYRNARGARVEIIRRAMYSMAAL